MSIFGYFFRFIAAIVGITFAFVGIVLLIALVASLFAIPFSLFVPFDIGWLSVPFGFELFTNSVWMTFLSFLAAFLIIGVPIAFLIYAGIRMIFDYEPDSNFFVKVLVFIWLIGLAILSFVVITALLV